MPIEWRPDMSIAEFIAYRQRDLKRKGPRPRTIFRKTADGETAKTISSYMRSTDGIYARSSHSSRANDDMHSAEGTLEMQHSLLLRVAQLENVAKGCSTYGPKSLQPQSRCYMTEAEQQKRELFQALYTIWNSRQEWEVKGGKCKPLKCR
jgi:hypothetical protein